jgi:hypothetical protein
MPSHYEPAYVYAIASQAEGPVKVGMTVHVSDRLAVLRCTEQNPRLRVAKTWWANRLANDMERLAHNKLATARIGGDWFAGPVEDVVGYLDCLFGAIPLERAVEFYVKDRERGVQWPSERAFRLIDRARHAVDPYPGIVRVHG